MRSVTDASELLCIFFLIEQHSAPLCRSFVNDGDVFPCLCGIAAMIEKHEKVNMYQLISMNSLIATWKRQYQNFVYPIPFQSDVDMAIIKAAEQGTAGNLLKIPVSVP